ncbi:MULTISPECIES: sugar ABC transporter permease [Paenibacillus]|uniref:sugar ABC transporter permease n=1 Tax=Paenibacillus TaxID=44249 RepID=UPI0009566E9F|nr:MULTISPECIES: sugar ABC transporter permease [Paenibacillus]ASS68664.1 sugar ABC transporter permease [Paenibacillus sp. RUD330]SIR55277.1 arabinogalactan oligomer / maltooligosaccharide transport system permease protein [Paenibacillus sp. RU4X]SIR63780.1 arabinogalactan oligomer / maltooligosaccharide transport system permease protein [Paenibacillus sp. RU4T]
MNRKTSKIFRLSLSYLFLVISCVCVLYPTVWVVLASFRPGKSLYSKTLIPERFTLDHYRELFTSKSFLFADWYMNTLKIALMTMVLGTLLVLLTGYAVSRFRFKGRQNVLSVVLVLGMFPGFMSLIALYILLKSMNLMDTHFALVLVYSMGAPIMGAFLAKGFFDTIPRSLDEAARIDGANNITIFFRIMLPLSKPMLAYLALTQFVGPWVDFIFAKMVLRTRENFTVAVGLYEQISSMQNSNFTLFAAASVLIAAPIAILFMFMQRFFVDGLTAGASKG